MRRWKGRSGESERQRHRLRGQPHRLQSESRERKSGERSKRESDPPCKSGVADWNETEQGNRQPGGRGEERAPERRDRGLQAAHFTFIPG